MEKVYLKRRAVAGIALAVVLLLFLVFCVHIIPTGFTGVKTSFGQVQAAPIQNGSLVITLPPFSTLTRVNNKLQDIFVESQVWGETADKAPVYASGTTVTFRISPDRSPWIIANVTDYAKNLVGEELVASAMKSAMAALNSDEVTVRSCIEPLVKQTLQASLDEKYGQATVTVSKVVINDMDFEQSYSDAIFARSIAQINYERQKIENDAACEKARAEKMASLTKAEAEADATRIAAYAQADANQLLAGTITEELIAYRKVEKWDGALPKATCGGGSFLDMGNFLEEKEAG